MTPPPRPTVIESLETSVDGLATVLLSGARAPDAPSPFGRYRDAVEIARGSRSRILRAIDPDIGRPVAIKALDPERGDAADLIREARITGLLCHPNIPPVYEVGRSEDGSPFFALELVEGHGLDELPAGDRSSSRQLVATLDRATDAIAFAHDRGVVHGGLEPAAIRAGAFGEVFVIDWARARYVAAGADPAEDLAALGRILEAILGPRPPDELAAIARSARSGRYPDAAAFQADLRRFRTGHLLEVVRYSAPRRLVKWALRYRALAAVAAIGLAAALALVIGLIVAYVAARDEARQAIEAERTADAHRALAEDRTATARRQRDAIEARQAALRRQIEREGDQATIERLEDGVDPLALGPSPAIAAWLERARALAGRLEGHRAARRAMDPGSWRREMADELIARIEVLAGQAIPALERRLLEVRALERNLEADAGAWAAASLAIGLSERYRGLDLVPQAGLVPIGPDPASGLWEFAHLESGRPAARIGEGSIEPVEGAGLVFVLVPPGEARVAGIDGEARQRPARFEAFLVSKFEMTQDQWSALTGQRPSAMPGPLRPVESVSWFEASEVLARVGLALPAEAAWEYAARGGSTGRFSFGNDGTDLERHAWCRLNSGGASHPVGRWPANGFGLHDVHGNVDEWCADRWAPGADSRVVRGGHFLLDADRSRLSKRHRDAPDGIAERHGLRPVRPIR